MGTILASVKDVVKRGNRYWQAARGESGSGLNFANGSIASGLLKQMNSAAKAHILLCLGFPLPPAGVLCLGHGFHNGGRSILVSLSTRGGVGGRAKQASHVLGGHHAPGGLGQNTHSLCILIFPIRHRLEWIRRMGYAFCILWDASFL